MFSFVFYIFIQAQTNDKNLTKGKNPIIIIPGLTGSELINSKTGEIVWFNRNARKTMILRLPISSLDLSQKNIRLVAGDIIRVCNF